jgi:hypothetical protein
MASKKTEAKGGGLGTTGEAPSWKPPKTLPEEVGKCIDLLVKARQERKRREAEAKKVSAVEEHIKEHIIETFGREKISGAKGTLGSATLSEKDTPQISDYEAFCEYVKDNDAWDLFQRRPGEVACQARWESGVVIPGVTKFHKKDISLSETKG